MHAHGQTKSNCMRVGFIFQTDPFFDTKMSIYLDSLDFIQTSLDDKKPRLQAKIKSHLTTPLYKRIIRISMIIVVRSLAGACHCHDQKKVVEGVNGKPRVMSITAKFVCHVVAGVRKRE